MNYLDKKAVVSALLNEGSVLVRLDSGFAGVSVPQDHRRNDKLLLQVGYGMAVQIPDLTADDVGISGTLSFNQAPYFCLIPWGAVYGVASSEGPSLAAVSWPKPTQPDAVEKKPAKTRAQAKKLNKPTDRSHLRLV